MEIASTYKITYHSKKIEAYLLDKPIFPATLELDITNECNRECPECPRLSSTKHRLSMDFIESLFASLEGQTKGLIMTGGEPTMAPHFPEAIEMAKKYGFVDIAVVTNGSFLEDNRVSDALLKYASTIRISMHDWSENHSEGLHKTLKRIEALRSMIDNNASKLQIGVSALTSEARADSLKELSYEVRSAGAHWIYFHPLCLKWDTGSPVREGQKHVIENIKGCQNSLHDGFKVFTLHDRYAESDLNFEGYHAAHFLLPIGADGMNYLGAEVKYQPNYIIADVAGDWRDDFLWQRARLERIRSVNSRTYSAIGSRHRGSLFSHLIERFKKGEKTLSEAPLPISKDAFMFPHIL